MALTGKQIRHLRSLAHTLDPVIQVGKADITDALVKQADQALEAHELIKCSVQDGSSLSCREAANELAGHLRAEVVQIIGRRFSLYRVSTRDNIKHIFPLD